MTRAERAVLATSEARDLCLSLQRAFVGPGALERLRAGEAAQLSSRDLVLALGLAWAARDIALVRESLARLSTEQIAGNPVLLAFHDATR